MIPKSQYTELFRLEKRVANLVSRIFGMLTTVGFDDQLSIAAHKIHNIWTDLLLANEFEAAEATVAQSEPQLHFGRRRISAKPA